MGISIWGAHPKNMLCAWSCVCSNLCESVIAVEIPYPFELLPETLAIWDEDAASCGRGRAVRGNASSWPGWGVRKKGKDMMEDMGTKMYPFPFFSNLVGPHGKIQVFESR